MNVFIGTNAAGFQLSLSHKARQVLLQRWFPSASDALAPAQSFPAFLICLATTATPEKILFSLLSCTSSECGYWDVSPEHCATPWLIYQCQTRILLLRQQATNQFANFHLAQIVCKETFWSTSQSSKHYRALYPLLQSPITNMNKDSALF